jgi:biofilm PGA synthesis protein PgaD
MKNFELIIEKPEVLRKRDKYTSVSITLIFWFILFYLWHPVISLLAWVFGIKLFYEHMIVLGGADGFMQMLFKYLLSISILGGGLILWALYNKFRFRKKVRRAGSSEINSQDVAEYFKISSEDHENWKSSKNMLINISDELVIKATINS